MLSDFKQLKRQRQALVRIYSKIRNARHSAICGALQAFFSVNSARYRQASSLYANL